MPLSMRTTPANGGERAQVLLLLDTLYIRTGRRGRPRKRLKALAMDKGYDAKDLRHCLRRRGIRPQIPKRMWKNRRPQGRPTKREAPRYQAERTVAWLQRKYRRVVVRWERLAVCFDAFLALAMIHLWVRKLIVG
jgi:IS5 family transposase